MNKNINQWYSVFLFYIIHFYFITSFEVLFYLYYILPYEHKLLDNLFDVYEQKTKEYFNEYNVSFNQSIIKYDCGHNRMMTHSNEVLFSYCYNYLLTINVILITVWLTDVYYVHAQLIKSEQQQPSPKIVKNSISFMFGAELKETYVELAEPKTITRNDAEFIDIVADPPSIMSLNSQQTNKIENYDEHKLNIKKIIHHWLTTSIFVQEFNHSVCFIIIIGVFEYIFFTQIVNRFKIFNVRTFLCDLVKKNILI